MKLHEFKSEPQNIEYRTAECRSVESLRSVFFKIDRIHYFDIRHSLFDVRVSRRHTALSLCFTNGAVQMNQILPVRVRPRTEIAARTRIAGYEASAAW